MGGDKERAHAFNQTEIISITIIRSETGYLVGGGGKQKKINIMTDVKKWHENEKLKLIKERFGSSNVNLDEITESVRDNIRTSLNKLYLQQLIDVDKQKNTTLKQKK